MKLRTTFVLLIVLLLFIPASATKGKGRLTIGAKASLYNPPGPSATTMLFEVTARYRMSDKLTGELSMGWTQYKAGGKSTTMVPIQINAEFHPMGRKVFDPYLGGGSGAYFSVVEEELDVTLGIQVFGGVMVRPSSGFGLSIQVKYMLADVSDSKSGGFSLGGGVEGSWETAF